MTLDEEKNLNEIISDKEKTTEPEPKQTVEASASESVAENNNSQIVDQNDEQQILNSVDENDVNKSEINDADASDDKKGKKDKKAKKEKVKKVKEPKAPKEAKVKEPKPSKKDKKKSKAENVDLDATDESQTNEEQSFVTAEGKKIKLSKKQQIKERKVKLSKKQLIGEERYKTIVKRRRNALTYTTVWTSSLLLGAVGPTALILFYTKKPGKEIPNFTLSVDERLLELASKVGVEAYEEGETGANPKSINDYDQIVIDSANWIEFSASDAPTIAENLNIKNLTIPPLDDEGDMDTRFYYKLSAAGSASRSVMMRKRYFFNIKVSNGVKEANKTETITLWSSDRYSSAIGTDSISKVTLGAWIQSFNDTLITENQGKPSPEHSQMVANIQTSWRETDINNPAIAFVQLGFHPDAVETALSMFPYANNGVRVRLWYRYEWVTLNEGEKSVARLSVKAKYPTADGKFVEVDNMTINGQPNNSRATITSRNVVPFTPTTQEKLQDFVASVNYSLTPPSTKTIQELERNVTADYAPIVDYNTLLNIGFISNTLEDILKRKNTDIQLTYKFERKLYNVNRSAQYGLTIKGYVANGQLVYEISDKQVYSVDKVPATPTSQSELRTYVDGLARSLMPATDKTSEFLNRNTSVQFTQFFWDSTLATIGFTGADLTKKPADVTLWYKLELKKSVEGEKFEYELTIRGLTTGINNSVPQSYQNSEQKIVSSDIKPVVIKPTSQEDLDEFIKKQVQGSITARTDMLVADLDSKVKNVYTIFTTGSEVDALGFTGTDITNKPADVTLYYRFTKGKAFVGEKPKYSLSIRGTTSGLDNTKSLTSVTKDIVLTSFDTVLPPENPTTQVQLKAYVDSIRATVPTNKTIAELTPFLQTTQSQFDINVLQAMGFTSITFPEKPVDVGILYKFTQITDTSVIQGTNIEYALEIEAYTTQQFYSYYTYQIFSSDVFVIPPTQTELNRFMDTYTLNVINRKTIAELDALIQETPEDINDSIYLAYGLERFIDTNTVPFPAGAKLTYRFINISKEDKREAVYSFIVTIDTDYAILIPVTKTFRIDSRDVTDLPTEQAELNRFVQEISFINPNREEQSIDKFDSLISSTKKTLDLNVFTLFGFVSGFIPPKEADVTLEYTFTLRTQNDGQKSIYSFTIYATTTSGLTASRIENVVSYDVLQNPTDETELEAFMNSIMGTPPLRPIVDLKKLVRHTQAHFDLNVLIDTFGFTDVQSEDKPNDVRLMYTFIENPLVDGQYATYNLEIFGTTDEGLEFSKMFVVSSSDKYDAPTTLVELGQLVEGFDLTMIDRPIAELDAFITYGSTFDNHALTKFDFRNIDLSRVPKDVNITYTFIRGATATAGSKQSYNLVITATAGSLTYSRTKTYTSSDTINTDQVDVATNSAAIYALLGSSASINENTISTVPSLGETNASNIFTGTYNPTNGVAVTYRVIIVKDYEATFTISLSKGAARDTITANIVYTKIRDVKIRERANYEVDQVKKALTMFNASLSQYSWNELSTIDPNSPIDLSNYFDKFGIEYDDIFTLMDEIDFTFRLNNDTYSIDIIATLTKTGTSYTGSELEVEFMLFARNHIELSANSIVNKVISDIRQSWGMNRSIIKSELGWDSLKDLMDATINNYSSALGIPRVNSLEDLNQSSFVLMTEEGIYTIRFVLTLNYPGTTIPTSLRTLTYDVEARDSVEQNANKAILDLIEEMKTLDGDVSSHNWDELKDASIATQFDYTSVFGIRQLSYIFDVSDVLFKATNGTGADAFTKTITAVITMEGTSLTLAQRTYVFKIHSPDVATQEANEKIKAAVVAISLMSFNSTLNWDSFKDLTAVSKEHYASLLGLASSDAILAVNSVTFSLEESERTFVKKLTITLNETLASSEYRTVTIVKDLVAADKDAKDIAAIDAKVWDAINLLKTLQPSVVSTHNWSKLQVLGVANKNNYAAYYGISSLGAQIGEMQLVTFTTSDSTTSYTKRVTAVISMEKSTVSLADRTVVFEVQARNKATLDANDLAEQALSELKQYGSGVDENGKVISTLNWDGFHNLTAAELDKTNFATLLGLQTPGSSIANVDSITFTIANKNMSIESTNPFRFIKVVTMTLHVTGSSLPSSYLTHSFEVEAKDKDVQDAAASSSSANFILNEGANVLRQIGTQISILSWTELNVLIGSSAVRKGDFVNTLGISLSEEDDYKVQIVDSVNFTVEAVPGENYKIKLTATMSQIGATPMPDANRPVFYVEASNKVALDNIDEVLDAIRYMETTFDQANSVSGGFAVSTLNWDTLDNATSATVANYYSVLGIAKNTAFDKLELLTITVVNTQNVKYSKTVTMVFGGQGVDGAVDINLRTFSFNLKPQDYNAQITEDANDTILNAIAVFQSYDGQSSSLTFDMLRGITTTFNTLNVRDYWNRLGLPFDATIAQVDSIRFMVTPNDTESYTFDISATLTEAGSTISNQQKIVMFVIKAKDKDILDANNKLNEVMSNIRSANMSVSTRNWGDGNNSGLNNVSSANKDNYISELGIVQIDGLWEMTSATFTVVNTPNVTFSKRVTVVVELAGSNIPVADRTYVFNMNAADKAQQDLNEANVLSEEKVQAAREALLTLSKEVSKINWDALQNVPRFYGYNFIEVLDLDLTIDERELVQGAVDKLDAVEFVHIPHPTEKYALQVRATLLMEGAASNGLGTVFMVQAADKPEHDANDLILEAGVELRKITRSSATWETMTKNTTATYQNYAERLGIISNPIFAKLDIISFSWNKSPNVLKTYTIEVTVSMDHYPSSLPESDKIVKFELEASNKTSLDIADANKRITDAIADIQTFHNTISTLKWREGLEALADGDLDAPNQDDYETMLGVPLKQSIRNLRLKVSDNPETWSGGADFQVMPTGSYQLRVVVMLTTPKTTLTSSMRRTAFTLSAKDKRELEADDIVKAAKDELDPVLINPEKSLDSLLKWDRIKDVTEADKTNFHSKLGISIGDMNPIRTLDALNVEVINKPGVRNYTKIVKVEIVQEFTNYPPEDLNYEFELVAMDQLTLQANDRINDIFDAVKTLDKKISTLKWAEFEFEDGATIDKADYFTQFGVPELDAIVDAATDVTFDAFTGEDTYTWYITATVHDEDDADIANTYNFSIIALDKPTLDANDAIGQIKIFYDTLNNVNSDSITWDEFLLLPTADKETVAATYGIASHDIVVGIDLISTLVVTSEVIDPAGATDDSQGQEYMLKLMFVVTTEHDDLPEEEKMFAINVGAMNKPTLDANDQVERTLIALDELKADYATGTNASTKAWADLSPTGTIDNRNYTELLGIDGKDEIARANNVTFTLTNKQATNNSTDIVSRNKYIKVVRAVIDQPHNSIDSSRLTFTFEIDASDKHYQDVYDFVLNEKTRVANLGPKATNFSITENGETYNASNRLIASNLVIADPEVHTTFINTANYGTQAANTKSTWALKSTDDVNGTAVVTTTIVSTHADADEFTFPEVTQDFNLRGFLTLSAATVATRDLINPQWWTSTRTRADIVAQTGKTFENIVGSTSTDTTFIATNKLIKHHIARNKVTVTYGSLSEQGTNLSAPGPTLTTKRADTGSFSYAYTVTSTGNSFAGDMYIRSSDKAALYQQNMVDWIFDRLLDRYCYGNVGGARYITLGSNTRGSWTNYTGMWLDWVTLNSNGGLWTTSWPTSESHADVNGGRIYFLSSVYSVLKLDSSLKVRFYATRSNGDVPMRINIYYDGTSIQKGHNATQNPPTFESQNVGIYWYSPS